MALSDLFPIIPRVGLSDQGLDLSADPAQAPILNQDQEPTLPQLTLLQRLLQGFAGAEAGPTIEHPRNFGEGLASGLVTGLGSAATRSLASRAKLEAIIEEHAKARNAANARATLELQKERATTAKQEAGKVMVDDALIAAHPEIPGLAGLKGQTVSRAGLERAVLARAPGGGTDETTRFLKLSPPEQARFLKAHQQLFPGAAGGVGSTQDTVKLIADAVESGNAPPDLKGYYRLTGPVTAELQRRGYNRTAALRDWLAVKSSIVNLNGPQQTRLRQAVETALPSLDVIDELSDRLEQLAPKLRTVVSEINHVTLGVIKRLPGEPGDLAQALEAQIGDVTSELANAYMGGNSPTDQALRLAAQNLQANWANKRLKSLTRLARINLTIRRNSIYQTSPINPGQAPPPIRDWFDQNAPGVGP